MFELLRRHIDGRMAVVGATERSDGDMHPDDLGGDLRERQHALVGSGWVMLDQQHGIEVHTLARRECVSWPIVAAGDVLVAPGRVATPIGVWAADCAPIIMFGSDGTRAAVHAGWRGLQAGVLDVAVGEVGAVSTAVLGPSIHPCCYAFGSADLADVATSLDLDLDIVSATTSWGTGALDVPGVIAAVLGRHGIGLDAVGPCTGCDVRFYSHRRRNERERHAVISWFEEAS